MRAFAELDNKIVMGRILHIRPAFQNDKNEEQVENKIEEKSSFKKLKKVVFYLIGRYGQKIRR